jgi:hypothetical protein
LQRVQFHFFVHTLSQSLDRDNGPTVGALGRIDTGHNRLAVYENGARAALGFFTSDLCACEVKSLAEEGGEGFTRDGSEGMGLSVNGKGNWVGH